MIVDEALRNQCNAIKAQMHDNSFGNNPRPNLRALGGLVTELIDRIDRLEREGVASEDPVPAPSGDGPPDGPKDDGADESKDAHPNKGSDSESEQDDA